MRSTRPTRRLFRTTRRSSVQPRGFRVLDPERHSATPEVGHEVELMNFNRDPQVHRCRYRSNFDPIRLSSAAPRLPFSADQHVRYGPDGCAGVVDYGAVRDAPLVQTPGAGTHDRAQVPGLLATARWSAQRAAGDGTNQQCWTTIILLSLRSPPRIEPPPANSPSRRQRPPVPSRTHHSGLAVLDTDNFNHAARPRRLQQLTRRPFLEKGTSVKDRAAVA